MTRDPRNRSLMSPKSPRRHGHVANCVPRNWRHLADFRSFAILRGMPAKPFGRLTNYIAMYRKRCGLYQSELATLIGVDSNATIGRYESGQMVPSCRELLALSIALEQPIDEILAGMVEEVREEVAGRAQALLEAMTDQPTRENILKLPVLARLAHRNDEYIIPWEDIA